MKHANNQQCEQTKEEQATRREVSEAMFEEQPKTRRMVYVTTLVLVVALFLVVVVFAFFAPAAWKDNASTLSHTMTQIKTVAQSNRHDTRQAPKTTKTAFKLA